jgi:hypothetical protein
MRSSRLALPRLLFLWCLEPSADLLRESRLVSDGYYLCNNYTLFMTFGYLLSYPVFRPKLNAFLYVCQD